MATAKSVLEDALPYDEEFLYHLSRGSEFLIANRVVEAKDELEQALHYQPRDAKGQDLLAGVYFRLGVYPRAIELWTELVRVHPNDVALRVNLGLAMLKTAQIAEAIEHLTRATSRDPGHARAWGYLGLAYWRDGRLDRAREAFVRGGQASMVRRLEEAAGMASPPSIVRSIPPPAVEVDPDRPSELPPADVEPSKWADVLVGNAPIAIRSGALVLVSVRDPLFVRRALVVAHVGVPDDAPILRLRPGDRALAFAPEGRGFHLVVLRDEALFVVADVLAAFEATLTHERRSVALGATTVDVAHVRGSGTAAVLASRRPIALPLTGGQVSVVRTRLLGWAGRVLPAASTPTHVTLTGEGTVFLG